MYCPYCGAVATKKATGNGGELSVAEDDDNCTETYDVEISLFHCTISDHIFYADDLNGNKNED